MIKSYLKLGFRSLRRSPGYALINAGGLAIGIVCCLFIVLFVRDELSYDRYHAKADRIHRVNMYMPEADRELALTPTIAAVVLKDEFPAVEAVVRFMSTGGVVRRGDVAYEEDDIFYADSTVFDVFSWPFVAGSSDEALNRPNTVVLTESSSAKYFAAENPIGKTIQFGNGIDYEVTGVIKDVPRPSHFHFDFLASFASLSWAEHEVWDSANFYTYALLHEDADPDAVQQQIDAYVSGLEGRGSDVRHLLLRPLTRIHLYSDVEYEIDASGSIGTVYAFSAMAVLILLIACINYMNLSTARSATRAREVGMRRVLGARRSQLAGQFYGEAGALVMVSLVLAIGLAAACLPLFNRMSGKAFSVGVLAEPSTFAISLCVGVAVAVLAGSYPALFLSSFRPVRVLKGAARQGPAASRLRQGLVVFQFGISIFLIIATVVVVRQLGYVQTKNLGFDKARLVALPMNDAELRKTWPSMKQALLDRGAATDVTAVNQYPGRLGWTSGLAAEGLPDDNDIMIKGLLADQDIAQTLKLTLLAGRDFPADPPEPVDGEYRYLLNETALKEVGWRPEDAVGKRINVLGGRNGVVIGVVEDFHFASLHTAVEPLAIWYDTSETRSLLVRLAPGDVAQALRGVEQIWKERAPHRPFTYEFLDATFDRLYRSEQQTARVFGVFATLANLVACLGLFGLASFTAEQRTKEIGVRKVVGASARQIVVLFSRDFARLVLIAAATALPVAYLVMRNWLSGFAYHVDLAASAWIFVAGVVAALSVALATVSYHAFRVSRLDPAETLRYE